MMDVIIVNLSDRIDDDKMAKAVAAINKQVNLHFQPEWGVGGRIHATRLSLQNGQQAPINIPTDATVYFGDMTQDPATGISIKGGYHDTNYKHTPYGFVFLDVCEKYNEDWTCTLSHEVLEMLADPRASMTVSGPAPGAGPDGPFVNYSLEVCDPTQSDSYLVDEVSVCNFVMKSYFAIPGGASQTNYLKLDLKPFGVRPLGYINYSDGSNTHTINGNRVDGARLAAREMMGEVRRNARRAARLRDSGHKRHAQNSRSEDG